MLELFYGTGMRLSELAGLNMQDVDLVSDQVKVRGSVGMSNARLHATLGFQSAISNSFTIIANDSADAVAGTFNGLAQGSTLFINGIPFRIGYIGGSGNDVVLTQLLGVPSLKIQRSGTTNVVLSWPTNVTGFTLESNTNLNTGNWTFAPPAPVVSGTNNVVTNAASGRQNSTVCATRDLNPRITCQCERQGRLSGVMPGRCFFA